MRAILELVSGPDACRKAVIAAGGAVTVGRTELADLQVGSDDQLAGVHFTVRWDGARCHLEASPRAAGVLVNGAPAAASRALASGDWIRAGASDFVVSLEGATLRRRDAQRRRLAGSRARRALELLRARPEPLFAVVDAARSDRALELVREAVDAYGCLFQGKAALRLGAVAPYLVALDRSSALLEQLILEGWGRRWGVFLAAACPHAEVRAHLRRLTLVIDERSERELYFRFYDPGVLRVFAPTMTPRQRHQLVGPCAAWLYEGAGGELETLALA